MHIHENIKLNAYKKEQNWNAENTECVDVDQSSFKRFYQLIKFDVEC